MGYGWHRCEGEKAANAKVMNEADELIWRYTACTIFIAI